MKRVAYCIAVILLTVTCSKKNINCELFEASKKGDAEKVESLIGKGADPNAEDPDFDRNNPDYNPRRAIEAAIESNSIKVVHLLFRNGARMPDKSEAVHRLISGDNPDARIPDFLASMGVDLGYADLGGDTPMSIAVRKGRDDIVKVLYRRGYSHVDASGDKVNCDVALNETRRSGSVKLCNEPLSFTGKYDGAYLGFENDGYYFVLKHKSGKKMVFRSDENPEIAFFVISAETNLPVENRALLGSEFRVYYTAGVEVDTKGDTVPVLRYIHGEVIDKE